MEDDMIYITGDTHGYCDEFMQRLAPCRLTAEDVVIVTGDFGFVWGDPDHNLMLRKLSELDCTIAFVDGNHENFEFLYLHPVEEWCGGRVHRIERNILHLIRGEVFTIQGKKFFAFGGAYSVDRYMRRENVSWWRQELPDAADYRNADDNLMAHDCRVDYVLTHTVPRRFIRMLGHDADVHDLELTGFLGHLYKELEFKRWFAGHWHVNRSFEDGRMNILWEDIVRLE